MIELPHSSHLWEVVQQVGSAMIDVLATLAAVGTGFRRSKKAINCISFVIRMVLFQPVTITSVPGFSLCMMQPCLSTMIFGLSLRDASMKDLKLPLDCSLFSNEQFGFIRKLHWAMCAG